MRLENDLDELMHKTNRLYATSSASTIINQSADDDEMIARRDSIIIGDN
jgi:hypothetical protein